MCLSNASTQLLDSIPSGPDAQNSCNWCIKVTQERCRVGLISTPALKKEVHMIRLQSQRASKNGYKSSKTFLPCVDVSHISAPCFHPFTQTGTSSLTSRTAAITNEPSGRWACPSLRIRSQRAAKQRNWIEAVNDCESLKSSVADSWNFI